MAQIKKLQPGGTTPEKTTPKYGRLIQNGVEIQANDDMINWLAQQGYYGEQMANNLRNGDDQYLDTDEQGVGWIRNISAANPELKEKQQERTTRASRRLEGRRLNQARTDIQRLATYDYSKFAEKPKAKTPYKWDTLVIDYNQKEDGTKEFSNNQVNFDIIQRLTDLKNGLVIPEGQEFKDYDRVVQHYNNIKDLLGDLEKDGKEGVISRMRAGKLTADDEDILEGLGIYVTAPKKDTSDSKEKLTEEATTKSIKKWLNTNLKLNNSDLSTHSSYWKTNDSNELVATDELYKLIGGNYKNYWFSPDSPYKGYVLLNGKLTPTNLVDEKGNQTAFGRWWESSAGQEFRNKYRAGLWSDAAEHMAFDGSNQTWNYVDPHTQISQYLDPDTVYYDVSHHYDFKPEYADGYIGVITKMNDPVNGELLPSYRDYAIRKEDGALVDISVLGGYYTRPLRPSSRPTKLNVYTLNPNGNFREFTYQYIDNSGKTHDILVTLDQNGKVVKLTENGKEINISEQTSWKNDGSNIWDIIREYLERKTGSKARQIDYNKVVEEKKNQGVDSFQPGGKLKSSTENKKYIQQVGAITDPTKSYSTKDFKEGFEMNDYDKAELAGLIADGIGLLATLVPGYGNAAAAGLGAVSSGANFYASLRDGFQLSDVLYGAGDLAMTLGTLVPGAGTGASLAKLTKGVVKAHKFLAPLFIGYGLYDGYDGLTKMLSGDFNIQDARAVANGLMALRGIVGNKKSHRTTRKYGVELDSDGKPRKPKVTIKENPLDTFLDNNKGDKKIEKLKKEIVDNLVKDNPNLKTLEDGTPVEWVDKDMKISDYEKAWEGLRKKSDHITDGMIIDNRTWRQGLGMQYQKAKQVISDAAEKGTNWFKQYIGELVVPADPTKYGLNPELDAVDLKAAKENRIVRSFMDSSPETWVLSKKNGGKVQKYEVGGTWGNFTFKDSATLNTQELLKRLSEAGLLNNKNAEFFHTRSASNVGPILYGYGSGSGNKDFDSEYNDLVNNYVKRFFHSAQHYDFGDSKNAIEQHVRDLFKETYYNRFKSQYDSFMNNKVSDKPVLNTPTQPTNHASLAGDSPEKILKQLNRIARKQDRQNSRMLISSIAKGIKNPGKPYERLTKVLRNDLDNHTDDAYWEGLNQEIQSENSNESSMEVPMPGVDQKSLDWALNYYNKKQNTTIPNSAVELTSPTVKDEDLSDVVDPQLTNNTESLKVTVPAKNEKSYVTSGAQKSMPVAGNILSQLSTTDIFGNSIASPNFNFTTRIQHPESSIEHATKGVLENSDWYNKTVSTLNGTRYPNSSINAPLIDYTGNITTNNLTSEQKTEAKKWAQDRVAEIRDKFEKPLSKPSSHVAGDVDNISSKPDWVGLAGPVVEGVVNSIANKKIHDLAQKALDIEAVGGQKSQSVQQPRQDYNLNPTLSLADRNKAEAWSRSNALASASADQRLRMSQHNFTAGNIAKAEQDLLGNVSKHITDVDLANTKLKWQFDKDAQAVADYNRTFGAQIGAQKARLKAQHIQQQGADLVKQIAESRDQYNKYKNVAGYAKNWDTYLKYHDEWMNEKDEIKKRELQSKLLLFKTMLESGSVMNPYTGITAADYLTNNLNRG